MDHLTALFSHIAPFRRAKAKVPLEADESGDAAPEATKGRGRGRGCGKGRGKGRGKGKGKGRDGDKSPDRAESGPPPSAASQPSNPKTQKAKRARKSKKDEEGEPDANPKKSPKATASSEYAVGDAGL